MTGAEMCRAWLAMSDIHFPTHRNFSFVDIYQRSHMSDGLSFTRPNWWSLASCQWLRLIQVVRVYSGTGLKWSRYCQMLSTQHDSTRLNMTQHDSTRLNTTQHDSIRSLRDFQGVWRHRSRYCMWQTADVLNVWPSKGSDASLETLDLLFPQHTLSVSPGFTASLLHMFSYPKQMR